MTINSVLEPVIAVVLLVVIILPSAMMTYRLVRRLFIKEK